MGRKTIDISIAVQAALAKGMDRRRSDPVHLLRVGTKRARALLRIPKSTSTTKKLRHQLHDIASKLAPIRERNVLEDQLGIEKRPHRRDEVHVRQAQDAIHSIQRQLIQAVGGMIVSSTHLRKALIKSYREARQQFHLCSRKSSSDRFHDLRRKTKRLQYQFELCINLLNFKGPELKQLEKLTHILGRAHDLAFLESNTDRAPQLVKTRKALEQNVITRGKKIFRERPKAWGNSSDAG